MSQPITMPVVVLAAGVFAAGCAQQETKPDGEAHSAPAWRTGSRIPVGRESEVKTGERTAVEEKLIQDMQRPVTPKTPSN